jgi:methyl-accepting chemotaxis protein
VIHVADENLGELVDQVEQTTDRLRALEEITSRVSRVSKELDDYLKVQMKRRSESGTGMLSNLVTLTEEVRMTLEKLERETQSFETRLAAISNAIEVL